jgi:hypothetical protein
MGGPVKAGHSIFKSTTNRFVEAARANPHIRIL